MLDVNQSFMDYMKKYNKMKLNRLLSMLGIFCAIVVISLAIPGLPKVAKLAIPLVSFFVVFGGGMLFFMPKLKTDLHLHLISFIPWLQACYIEFDEDSVTPTQSAVSNIYYGKFESDRAHDKSVTKRAPKETFKALAYIEALLFSLSQEEQGETKKLGKMINTVKEKLMIGLIHKGKSKDDIALLKQTPQMIQQITRFIKLGGLDKERSYKVPMGTKKGKFTCGDTTYELITEELTWLLRCVTLAENNGLQEMANQLITILSKADATLGDTQTAFTKWMATAQEVIQACQDHNLYQ